MVERVTANKIANVLMRCSSRIPRRISIAHLTALAGLSRGEMREKRRRLMADGATNCGKPASASS